MDVRGSRLATFTRNLTILYSQAHSDARALPLRDPSLLISFLLPFFLIHQATEPGSNLSTVDKTRFFSVLAVLAS